MDEGAGFRMHPISNNVQSDPRLQKLYQDYSEGRRQNRID